MKIRLTVLVAAALLAACANNANNSNTNAYNTRANSNLYENRNTAVNTSPNTNSYSSNSNRWNSNISREEYEKNRPEYEKNKGTSETIGQSLEDSWLWFKTKSALMTTSDLRDSTINVDVQNGVVTLKGTVADAAQKAKAKQVADGIEGKKSVVDQLKVAPNDSMTNQTVNGNKATNKPTNKK